MPTNTPDNMNTPAPETSDGLRADGIKLFLVIAAMLGVMVGSIYYPWPSGEPLGVKGFIMLWLREIIILGAIAFGFLLGGVLWLRRRLQRSSVRGHNAP